jgi:hypothetical protein
MSFGGKNFKVEEKKGNGKKNEERAKRKRENWK